MGGFTIMRHRGRTVGSGDKKQAEKIAQEAEKLALETQLLRRQLSPQGVIISWLQATSVPVALLGAILAFFVGFGQLRQGADTQANNRLDQALTRLASQRPDERMTGVSGLNLFLRDGSAPQQTQALVFLVDALSLETDERVHGAIIDAINNASSTASQPVLNEGLRVAIERSDNLTNLVTKEWRSRILQQQKKALAKYKIPGVDIDAMEDKLPTKALQSISDDQYLSILDAEHGPFEMLDHDKQLPLEGLARAIQFLLLDGARSTYFGGIFCRFCDFSSLHRLDGVSFYGAYLVGAHFDRMSLRKASFQDAEIGSASFFAADLTGANFRTSSIDDKGEFAESSWTFPNMECATLSGADLSGRPLVLLRTRLEKGIEPQFEIELPRMSSVQVDGSTKLDHFSIITVSVISDDSFKAHKIWPIEAVLTNHRFEGLWTSPLVEGQYEDGVPRHTRPTKSFESGDTTTTINWRLDKDYLKKLRPEAFRLRSFIDQPTLRTLPLYSQFVDAVNALKIPQDDDGKLAQAQSEKAAQTWAQLKPTSCSHDVPGVDARQAFQSVVK